jgi:hypothetical protein
MNSTRQQRQAAATRFRSGARPSGGGETPETMADLAVAVGAASLAERDAWRDKFAADFPGTRAAMWAAHVAAVGNTPATPATAASGASVAAGSAEPPVTYPAGWAPSVAAAQRTPGVRATALKVARAAGRAVGRVHVAGSGPAFAAQSRAAAEAVQQQAQARTVDAFYSKAPQPSAAAAEQTARYEADLARMASEQRSRGIG